VHVACTGRGNNKYMSQFSRQSSREGRVENIFVNQRIILD
jgi:hypothetical protein